MKKNTMNESSKSLPTVGNNGRISFEKISALPGLPPRQADKWQNK